jgi:acyl-CoA synthetase (AMP-forming)/AMP-acid ligase II
MITADTLTGAFAAVRDADRTITYMAAEDQRRSVRFADAYAAALGVLYHFQQAGFAPGDEVILFTGNNEQFVDGFWACLLGGMVPVPVAVGIADDHRHKLLRIFARLRTPRVYTDQGQLARLDDFARLAGVSDAVAALGARALVVETITDISRPGTPHAAGPDDVAFIQFSSGSTSEPKGVVLTHRNVLTNIRAIVTGAAFTDRDTALSWMPLTHDMGLIGFHLTMLAARISHTLMDTRLFSRRPLAWLKEATRSRATLLSSPNFGYKHFLKVYEAKGADDLDLASVRLIFNGAEPISVPLCERFLTAMAPHGLAPGSMYPVYGLAEASLAVTFPRPGSGIRPLTVDRHSLGVGSVAREVPAGSPEGLQLMRLGAPLQDVGLRICGDDDQPLADGHIGHVQIRGGNVTGGYYGSDTPQPFTADGWLRTGDLGFRRDDDLVITGRYKEIIFVSGANYYPQDLEDIIARDAGIELGKAVVTASRPAGSDADAILVFVLHREDLAALLPVAERIRRALGEVASLEVAQVLPVRNIPKTTSGKLQRGRLAADYEAGSFAADIEALAGLRAAAVATGATAGSAVEDALRQICAGVITDRHVGVDDNLFDLGVSSLALAQIYERIDEGWPGMLDIEDLFQLPTIRDIAARLTAGAPAGTSPAS